MWRTEAAKARKASYYFKHVHKATMSKTSLEYVYSTYSDIWQTSRTATQHELFKKMNNKTCIIHCAPFCMAGTESQEKLIHIQTFGTSR